MWINKLERKFGKYAISNLSMYLIGAYIIGYVLNNAFPLLYKLLLFDPYAILHGQVWRIITWIVAFPIEDNAFFLIIMLIFYYSIGTALENVWGSFRYNLYIFSGLLFTMIGSTVLLCVLTLGDSGMNSQVISEISSILSFRVTPYYVNMSIFLAYAMTYPDSEILLYFIIPIKSKWLGFFYVVMMLVEMINGSWLQAVLIVTSLLNFGIFYFSTRRGRGYAPLKAKRRYDYKKKVRQGQVNSVYDNGARHKCVVCGRTENDNPDLTFRYCSKCTGGKEYCNEHLFTHQHN